MFKDVTPEMIKESTAASDNTAKEIPVDNTNNDISNEEENILTLVKIPLNQLKINHLFKCQKCSTYFDNQLIFENHVTSIHADVKAQFQCFECDQHPKLAFKGSEVSQNLTIFENRHLARFQQQNDRKTLIEMTSPPQQVSKKHAF